MLNLLLGLSYFLHFANLILNTDPDIFQTLTNTVILVIIDLNFLGSDFENSTGTLKGLFERKWLYLRVFVSSKT